MSIKLAIVDDKQANRNSLRDKMNFEDEFEVLFTASNGKDFLEQLKESKGNLPEVVLMDIDMPIMNGIEAVSHAHQSYPEIKFLMFTVFDDDDKVFEAIKSGAIGYLLKDEKVEVIIHSIKQIIEFGGSPMSPSIARKALKLLMNAPVIKTEIDEHDYSLSKRELEILQGLVDGYDYKELADKLFISPHTVRTHINKIYQKLQVNNKTQAIKIAINKRWF